MPAQYLEVLKIQRINFAFMDAIKRLTGVIVLFVSLLIFPGHINAQVQITEVVDTSDYIPYFYSQSLEYNLMIAASKGYVYEIERLIAKGAEVNAETYEGATPLILAISNNKLNAVNKILSYNPELNNMTINFESPLLISVKNRSFEITESLLRAGADVDFVDHHGVSSLLHASVNGYPEIVDLLLYYDASIDIKSDEGITPLHGAIWAGYEDIADILVQNGANMESRDNDGYTPFLMAAYYGDTLIMDILFKYGVDIYATNKSGHNALTLSILTGNVIATQYLLGIGNKWSFAANDSEIDPYYVASKYQRKEIIKLLEDNNIKGNLKYEIDQIAITASSRFNLSDVYTGFTLSFKEPFLNAGFIAGCDVKLWYTKVLIKESENLIYQYKDKGSVAYAGIFKDFNLTDRQDRFNFIFSTSLSGGYSFGNKLKGTMITGGNNFLIIPSLSIKATKMNFTFNMGMEYMKTEYYHNSPLWFRVGLSYNHFFDNVRLKYKTVKWY
jgi:ankyrin repeat protein